MIGFVGTNPFLRITFWVAMETMHLHIARMFFLTAKAFCIHEVPMNNLASIKMSLGEVQGRSN